MASPEFFTNAAGEPVRAEVAGAYIDGNFLASLGLGGLIIFGLVGLGGFLRNKAVQGAKDTFKSVTS